MQTRLESDSMGSIQVQSDKYYGAQTARSLIHFAIGEEVMPMAIVHAIAVIKKVCAQVNVESGILPIDKCDHICKAADEVIAGKFDAHFPLRVWQTGSGTQTNMNVNEVIANRAIELAGGVVGSKVPIHPNDDVNMSQSSNDVFPSAMHIAVVSKLAYDLLPSIHCMRNTLELKTEEYRDVVKIGRTHLMDAVPLTLGQEFSGYLAQVNAAISLIEAMMNHVYPLAMGATAVGTGLNAPPLFAERVAKRIADLIGLPFCSAPNKYAALAGHEPLVALSGALKVLATALMKMANDIRWMGSGPRCGLNELHLPENEPGSSIMPGKVNPTQCEALAMVCVQVISNDLAISLGASQGQFELNTYKPVVAYNILQSIRLLTDACTMFDRYCLQGIRMNAEQLAKNVSSSLMLITALAPHVGYEVAAAIVKLAHRKGTTLRQEAIAMAPITKDGSKLTAALYDELIKPLEMTQGRSLQHP